MTAAPNGFGGGFGPPAPFQRPAAELFWGLVIAGVVAAGMLLGNLRRIAA